MKFLDSVLSVLSIVKKGAEVYSALTDKDEDTGFATPQRLNLESKLTAPRASLKSMEVPIGLGLPNIETAYRYFSNNLSRDNNFRYVQGENYVAKRRSPTPATMTVASDARVKGFTASYKTTGVPSA